MMRFYMKLTIAAMAAAITRALGAATGAIEVGPRLWFSSTKSDRIGIFDLEP